MVTQEDADKALQMAMLEFIKPVMGGGLVRLTSRLVGAVVVDGEFTPETLSRPDGFAFDFGTSDQVAALFRSKGLHDAADKLEVEHNAPGMIRCVIHVQGKTTFEKIPLWDVIRSSGTGGVEDATQMAHALLAALGERGVLRPQAS